MDTPQPGEARKNAKGEWVDEHGNPMQPPGEGGREGIPEVVEDPVTGKLVPKKPKPKPKPTPTPTPTPTPDPDAEPKREDFPEGLAGAAAWNKARSEYQRKKKTSTGPQSPYPEMG